MILVECMGKYPDFGPSFDPKERVQTDEMPKISIFTHIPSTGMMITSFYPHETVRVNPQELGMHS